MRMMLLMGTAAGTMGIRQRDAGSKVGGDRWTKQIYHNNMYVENISATLRCFHC